MNPSPLTTARTLPVALTVLLVSGLLLVNFPAFSQSRYPVAALYRCSRDLPIIEAFEKMSGGPGEASLDRIVQKPMRVIFKDMRTLGKAFRNYDALSWISQQGDQVIFINEKHRTAPPEALAALISHEAMHADPFNSISEEIAGWQEEAVVWHEMKRRNPALANIPTGAFPLVDRINTIETEHRNGTLAAFVRARPGYTGLPESSPGFGEQAISQK